MRQSVVVLQEGRDELQRTLNGAGFGDLDRMSLVGLFAFFADALQEGPMSSSFGEINDRVGTRNGIASGLVLNALHELQTRGYLSESQHDGVALTPRGIKAAALIAAAVKLGHNGAADHLDSETHT